MPIRKERDTIGFLHTPSTVGGGGGVYMPHNYDNEDWKNVIDKRAGITIETVMDILLVHGQMKPAALLSVAAYLPKSEIRHPDEPHTFYPMDPEIPLRFEAFLDKYGIHWLKKEADSDDHRRTRRHPDGWIVYERQRFDYRIGHDANSLMDIVSATTDQEYGSALGFPTDAVDEFPPAIYGDDSWRTGEDWEVNVRWKPAADITSSRELATRWMLYIRENHPNLAIEFETNRDEWS